MTPVSKENISDEWPVPQFEVRLAAVYIYIVPTFPFFLKLRDFKKTTQKHTNNQRVAEYVMLCKHQNIIQKHLDQNTYFTFRMQTKEEQCSTLTFEPDFTKI